MSTMLRSYCHQIVNNNKIWSCFILKLYFFSFLTETCRNAEEYKPFAKISQLIQPANRKIALLSSVACPRISQKYMVLHVFQI